MLDNQYLILDKNLKQIGVLSTDGATQFTNDSIVHQLADADQSSDSYGDDLSETSDTLQTLDPNAESKNYDHSGSITVMLGQPDSDKLVVGNNIAYYEPQLNRWYVLHIWYADETILASGAHAVTIQVVNLALFDMAYRIPLKKNYVGATVSQAFGWLLQNIDWELDIQSTNAMTTTIDFDGSSKASAHFQTLLQTFNLECDCYVKTYPDGTIYGKVIELSDSFNASTIYDEAIIGENVTAINRTTIGTAVTKLYVFGPNGETMANANGGQTYIVDDSANQTYNPDWQDGTYLEASITTQTTKSPAGLRAYGEKLLPTINHNRIAYKIQCTHDYNAPLGATIRAKDFLITPVITVEARVISKTMSKANPGANTESFGEFVTIRAVTPAWLSGISNQFADALNKAKSDSSSIKPVILTPDGKDFKTPGETKRTILQAWEGNVNFTSFVDTKGFIWRKINAGGGFTGEVRTGYQQNMAKSDMGTWRGFIDPNYIQDSPEIDMNQEPSHVTKLGQFTPSVNGHYRTAQYIVKLSDGSYMSSHDWGSYGGGSHDNDTLYAHWDSNFNYISSMVIQDGGHGSSFGVDDSQGAGNSWYIWGVTKDFNSTDARYRVTCVTYQPGKTLTSSDSTLSNYLTFSSSDYIRVNFDIAHWMVGITRQDGSYEVSTVADIQAGIREPKYRINMFNYGFNAQNQTFQSSALYFPYVFWHSGDIDMHDPRTIYGVNVLHAGQEFQHYYDFDNVFDNTYNEREPEALSITTDGNLLVSFNLHDTSSGTDIEEGNIVYKVGLDKRPDSPVIDYGQIGE